MVIALLVGRYAPAQRALLRTHDFQSYSVSSRNLTAASDSVRRTNGSSHATKSSRFSSNGNRAMNGGNVRDSKRSLFYGGATAPATPPFLRSGVSALQSKTRSIRAMTALTSSASDFDLISDWWFYFATIARERELSETGENLVPPLLISILLFSCIMGSITWLSLASDGRLLLPVLKCLNIEGISTGYMLLFCVLVEDIPQMILTFLIEEYYDNQMILNNYAVINMMTSFYDMLIKVAEAYDERHDVVETGVWCKGSFRGHWGPVSAIAVIPHQEGSNRNAFPIRDSFVMDCNCGHAQVYGEDNHSLKSRIENVETKLDQDNNNADGGFSEMASKMRYMFARNSASVRTHEMTASESNQKLAMDVTPFFLTASYDCTVKLWNPSGADRWRKCLRTFRGHEARVTALAVLGTNVLGYENYQPPSPLYDDVTVGSSDITTYLAAPREFKRPLHVAMPEAIFFLSGSADGTIKLWHTKQKTPLRSYSYSGIGSSGQSVTGLAALDEGDSSLFVSSHDDAKARLWDVVSAQCIRIYRGHFRDRWITSLCATGDGLTFLTGSDDETIKLWDTTRAVIDSMPSDRGGGEGDDWTHTGLKGSLITFTAQQSARAVIKGRFAAFQGGAGTGLIPQNDSLCTMSTVSSSDEVDEERECTRTFVGHTGAVLSVSMMPTRHAFVSGAADRTARLWSIESGQCLQMFVGHVNIVSCLSAFDEHTILTGSYDKSIKLWDVNTGACLRTFANHKHYVSTVASCHNGETFLSGSFDRTVKLWVVTSTTIADSPDLVGSNTFVI